MESMTFADFTDLENSAQEEEQDALDTVVPPADIVAFTEQRSCADLYRMCQKGQIDLYPDFQRGEVWKNRAQTLFVDSMIKQLPIPSMCISLDVHSQKRYVIDGLQRITTICKFLGDNDWKLSKIDDVDERISGKKKVEIEQNSPDIIDIVMSGRTNEIDTKKLYNIGEYRIKVIINKIQSNFMLADIVEVMGGYMPFNIIKKLFDFYGSTDKIVKSLENKPYECLCRISRIGFKTADKILLELETKINKDIKEGREPPFKFNDKLRISKDRSMKSLQFMTGIWK